MKNYLNKAYGSLILHIFMSVLQLLSTLAGEKTSWVCLFFREVNGKSFGICFVSEVFTSSLG